MPTSQLQLWVVVLKISLVRHLQGLLDLFRCSWHGYSIVEPIISMVEHSVTDANYCTSSNYCRPLIKCACLGTHVNNNVYTKVLRVLRLLFANTASVIIIIKCIQSRT